jgi:hypothetical protein
MKTTQLFNFSLAGILVISFISCSGNKDESESGSDKKETALQKVITEGDFRQGYLPVVAYTDGIEQQLLATPDFMKEKFKKIDLIAPDSVLITYWQGSDKRINNIMGVAQFIVMPSTDSKEKYPLSCNEKTKMDYFEKFREGVQNPVIAYYDMNEDKISFDEQYGDVRESIQFVFLGDEILKIHRTGTNVTDYDLALNKTKLRRGTAEYKNANNYKDTIVLMLAAN